ncbi:MAG: DUF1269 domain-containing protein [Chloroflexota bacterium]
MSDLIVLTYETEEKAAEALGKVAALKQDNVQKALIKIEDAATAIKNENGKIKIRQTLESVVKGGNVVSGGLWGLLIGFLFGGPLLGVLLGMGINALLGRRIDLGIDNEFIDKVSDELAPGNSALFLLVNETSPETVGESLSEFGGTLFHTSLSDEAKEALSHAMDHEPIKAALEEQNS